VDVTFVFVNCHVGGRIPRMNENAIKRIAMGVEYDGSAFHGWQWQKHTPKTVQQVLETAVSSVANETVRVHCAGRTDTGVHGSEQVIHFDTSVFRDERAWVYGTNVNLPKSVCVLWSREVSSEFHARFSATARQYQYVIFNRNVRPTYLSYRTTWEYRLLDAEKMNDAAQALVGTHDFDSYRAVACQAKSPVRTLEFINVRRQGDFVIIDLQADGFLHHMVRNIAGVLMEVGAGKAPLEWVDEVLQLRDRRLGGVTAQPYGLYLKKITYPDVFDLPQLSQNPPVW